MNRVEPTYLVTSLAITPQGSRRVGQGVMTEQGSGNGQFNGSIFLAKTNSSTSPYSQLSVLWIPSSSGMAAALNGIQYNSCWANIGNDLHYLVVASREDSFPSKVGGPSLARLPQWAWGS